MTDLASGPRGSGAVDVAAGAALAARVTIRCLDELEDLEGVRRLYESIWRTGIGNPPVTADLLKAMVKAGSYVGGAYEGDELVGACFGFFSAPAEEALHSHIAGVSPRMHGRHVGFALKLHQRAWAMQRGIGEISWTFDPLVSRNAYFNLTKLAADPVEYLPDFYGPMDDDINRSDATDRLLVTWRLEGPAVVAAAGGRPRQVDAAAELGGGAGIALEFSPTGRPVLRRTDADTVLVAVPHDIAASRLHDGTGAADWRAAVRDVLGALLDDGARVRGFDRRGWYVVDRRSR